MFRRITISGPVAAQASDWSLRRLVAIGSVDDPVYGLSAVRDVLTDADLIAFAPDGSGEVWLKRGSWAGSGPAEFEVARIGVLGDTLFRRRIGYEPRPVPKVFFVDEISEQLNWPDVTDRGVHASALRDFYE